MERRARERGGTWSTLPGRLQRRCVCLCAHVCMSVCVCGCSMFPLSLQLATGARDSNINPDKEKTDEEWYVSNNDQFCSLICLLHIGS